jgi:threonylcarbamoyladenosine tRNA methylthiotransferase MtaB
MRRGHTAAGFRTLVEHTVATVPGIAVTADVIVGFPGEDARAFGHTSELLESLPLAGLHVFSYSRRPGTDAAGYPEQVSKATKVERSRALRDLATRKTHAFRERAVGDVLDVVALRRDGVPGMLEGLSDNYLRVWFPGAAALQGSAVRVRIEHATGRGVSGSLTGEQVSGSGGFADVRHASMRAGDSVDSPKRVQ